ncbi:hypothetical protein C1645_882529 [Glomus cerebriforme]|uniref:Uncharacterized protein n=1 Tax=Glomus cerebriforme TaxID=658196 RepID=A0A397S1C4_9GLOM|nr:hypothetical protein C1645_882529 [Glomus cerebriforme]
MIKKLIKKIKKIVLYKQKINTSLETNDISSIKSNYTSTSRLFISKVYQFTNLPEPRNATEEDQEVFHSKPYSFNIPYNIDDLNCKNDDNKDDSKILSKVFENMQIFKMNEYEKETIQQMNKTNIDNDVVDDEIYNNLNFHSEEQDELEIPDELFKHKE